jgi:hypothetical protein
MSAGYYSPREVMTSSTKSNNGMHPTADTVALISWRRLGEAGDARR